MRRLLLVGLGAVLLVGCGDGPDATFEVTFDGTECLAEGPSEVSPGEITVLLRNESDVLVSPAVRRFADGYTVEDADALFPDGEWGDEAYARPDWIQDVPDLGVVRGLELPLGDIMSRWEVGVTTGPGEHEIHLYRLSQGLWGCTDFTVLDE